MLELTEKKADPNTGVRGRLAKKFRPQSPEDCFESLVPKYALLFFDHLYSEFLTFKPDIADQEIIKLLEEIHTKRANSGLTWSDIYTFDLALVDVRPLENLIRKAYDARARYRSIAGQKEYDEYLASKPPDLTTILIAPNEQPPKPDASLPDGGVEPPDTDADSTEAAEPAKSNADRSKSVVLIQRVLRADIKYLLSKFYLYYSMLPMRESLREQLTSRAVHLTLSVLGIVVSLMVLSFGGIYLIDRVYGGAPSWEGFVLIVSNVSAFFLTLGSVALVGIIGGCVSMLQRIQSAPSEGDALFNLAALTTGWRGLSLSPLYGGIFASLLFVLFAAGILEGAVFPEINTPGKPLSVAAAATAASESASIPTTSGSSANQNTTAEGASQQTPPSATPTPKPPTQTQKTGILQINDFLRGTGPTDGVAFALLIIWSFIAGFAERLVPDTLNRLVAKNQAIQGTNT